MSGLRVSGLPNLMDLLLKNIGRNLKKKNNIKIMTPIGKTLPLCALKKEGPKPNGFIVKKNGSTRRAIVNLIVEVLI